MNKQENKLALSVLTTLISGIALIYTLIIYHDIIFAVMGMSMVFLICAYLLTQNVIAFNIAKSKAMNNQLKEYIDDISEQLETMSGTQSQLGKATYLYTKQAAQAVATLENNYIESQETLYKNLSSISSAQNKATKLMIKYDQSNTTKVISTIKELRSQLSDTMIQGFDQLQPDNKEMVEALEDIVNYLKAQPTIPDQSLSLQLNNVAHELQNISNNIQNFQVPVHNVVQAPPVQPTHPIVSEPIAESVMQTAKPVSPVAEVTETLSETDDTFTASMDDLLSNEEMAAFFSETPVAEEAMETVTAEETTETIIAEETATTETMIEPLTIDEVAIEEPIFEEPTEEIAVDNSPIEEPVALAPVTEDPNKQLSADEIAALFAAAEPAPKKETEPEIEEEKPFTPTFTVVGKSDEYREEKEPMTIGDLNEDPNKQLSADEIAALFAAADPAPKKEEKPVEVTPEPTITDDPNKQLSADEIAALFASAEPAPKQDTSDEEKRMDEAIAKASPEPVSAPTITDDPNKQLSADEIAALFASLG